MIMVMFTGRGNMVWKYLKCLESIDVFKLPQEKRKREERKVSPNLAVALKVFDLLVLG